jgi:PAS domain S-box-containing protein
MVQAPGHTDPVRVLVMDDDAEMARLMETFLRGQGHVPFICRSGKEALETAASERIDMVLLDIVMPGMDGLAVARQLKERFGKDNYVPIILVTALGQKETLVSGLAYADDYVKKPFAWEELGARIKAFRRTQILQRELVEARNRYEWHSENVPHMCVSLDRRRCIMNCNARFRRTIGREKAELIGGSFISLFTREEHAELESFLDSLPAHAPPEQDREPVFSLLCGEGGARPRRVTLTAMSIAGSRPHDVAVVIALEDVTRSLALEEEQKLARRQMYRSARLASIGTLASGVAHEMNNPLTAVLGFSSALLERLKAGEPSDTAEFKQYLELIHSEALRCRDIVETLSKFSREKSGSIGPVALLPCVESAIQLLSNSLKKKNMRVENGVGPDVSVRADPQKLGQAFFHVLANSVDFCPQSSVVRISAALDSQKPEMMKIAIRDNGPGIAPEIQPRVFDPFFTTKGVGQGAGLGLAMCHTIIEDFNGTIDIISGTGEGTTLIFWIPGGK